MKMRWMKLPRILFLGTMAACWWACGASSGGNRLELTPTQHTVSLSWKASTTAGVQYNIYRGTQHLGPYADKLNSSPQSGTTFTDSTVQNGMTYYYVVNSIDSESQESPYSNEAQAVIPAS